MYSMGEHYMKEQPPMKKQKTMKFVPRSGQLVTKSGTHPKILAYSDRVKKAQDFCLPFP